MFWAKLFLYIFVQLGNCNGQFCAYTCVINTTSDECTSNEC